VCLSQPKQQIHKVFTGAGSKRRLGASAIEMETPDDTAAPGGEDSFLAEILEQTVCLRVCVCVCVPFNCRELT
jgi:hypothetical protein